MKIPMSWIAEHVRLRPAEIADVIHRLPSIGVEVAGTEQIDGEIVAEVEITANRGDLLSIHGMAREIGAMMGRRARWRVVSSATKAQRVLNLRGAVSVDRGSGCRRYLGARIEGVRIAPSPDAIARRLRICGFAVLNNVVDITNLVLAEFGQPLHAFDTERLKGPIRVRRSARGEKIAALDGKTYTLENEMVIADDNAPVALAGVIGGANTSVSDSTRNIFLECAWFEPSEVRRSARRLGVATESSYRFERHVDPQGLERAFWRAIELIEEVAGGRLAGVAEAGSAPRVSAPIRLSGDAIERLLGIRISPKLVARILTSVGCRVTASSGERWSVVPPTYRRDLQIPEDLIEEIERLYGIDRIPSRVPTLTPARAAGEEETLAERVRSAALAAGLAETLQLSFLSAESLGLLGVAASDAVAIENPLSQAVSHLRPTLLPGLLATASLNIRRDTSAGVRLFEMGHVFLPGTPPKEELRLGILLTGAGDVRHFSRTPRGVDFFDVKGIVENILSQCGRAIPSVSLTAAQIAGFDGGASAAIRMGDTPAGCLGRIDAAAADKMDIHETVWAAEISLSRLLGFPAGSTAYRPLPKFPSIRRDMSLLIGTAVTADDIRDVVRSAGISDLVTFDIFDLYRGKGLPDDAYAIGLTFTFQSPERTLLDDEANAYVDRILARLSEKLGAKLRGV